MLTVLLAGACVVLIAACFYIFNGKRELNTKFDELTVKYNDTVKLVEARDSTIASNTRDIAALRSSLSATAIASVGFAFPGSPVESHPTASSADLLG